MAKLQAARFRNNQGLSEEVLESTRTLADAELELCASEKERVAVLEKILLVAKETERIAANFAKVGQGHETSALMAKTERLRFEIALERVNAKKPQKGAGNSEPDVKVKKRDQQKAITQPATIQAYESVRLFSRASGYLKKQAIDIGDRVKRGDVLAVVDVPDFEAQLRHDSAFLERERSRVDQTKSRIRAAEADLETAKLAVRQAEVNAKSAVVWTQHREKVWKRIKVLYDAKGIEERWLMKPRIVMTPRSNPSSPRRR